VTARFGTAWVIAPVTAWQVAAVPSVLGFAVRVGRRFGGCRVQHELPLTTAWSVRDRREGHYPATPVGWSFRRRMGVSTMVNGFDKDAVKRRQRAQLVALFRYQAI